MQAGTRLDHYEIVDKIGEGGMGAVYRAEDTRLRRQVAIKVLPPAVAADAERLARLEREAQLLASLSHPNVAAVHGFGDAEIEEDGVRRRVAFLVMEFVKGQSLYDRVAAGPMPWREATEIAVGIAAGLEAAHERGIVHRDLKPANVHLTTDGSVKVLDFGLAKAFDADGASGSLELSASPTVRRHSNRDDSRHRCLHEPRAGARQVSGQACRHLGARLRALRDAHRTEGLRGRDRVGRARGDPEGTG